MRDMKNFMQGSLDFILDAVAAAEPVLVVVDSDKIDLLRGELRGNSDDVLFADMAEVGTNPARIIPAWQDFLDERGAAHRRVRESASRSGRAGVRHSWRNASGMRRC